MKDLIEEIFDYISILFSLHKKNYETTAPHSIITQEKNYQKRTVQELINFESTQLSLWKKCEEEKDFLIPFDHEVFY